MTAPARKNERVPLQKVDVIKQRPFADISIDFVGCQYPKTTRGNKFLMVIIDNFTRWPHLVALRNVKTETVANALIDFFSYAGVPLHIRSDNHMAYNSELMQCLRNKLGIDARFSSVFHSQSHGIVERLNATIERILKTFIHEHAKDWDQMLPYLHIALRETPHSVTGFSPAQLVYGRNPGGLLQIARENWETVDVLEKCKKISTIEYVLSLQDKINTMLQFADENTEKANAKMHVNYNKACTVRHLTQGDQVLLLMPTTSNKLFVRWAGPYKVLRKLDNNGNYEIQMERRKAKFHINSLRKFYDNEEQTDELRTLTIINETDDNSTANDLMSFPDLPDVSRGSMPRPTDKTAQAATEPREQTDERGAINNIGYTVGQQLTDAKATQLQTLLASYAGLFNDCPGYTTIVQHRIVVKDQKPIYQPPYKIPESQKQAVENELLSMLDRGIIESTLIHNGIVH